MDIKKRINNRQIIEDRYDLLCRIADLLEPPPFIDKNKTRGKLKRTKGRNLAERLAKRKEAVLAFAFNDKVPFTKNLAERDLRPAKVKQKVSNCFRAFDGAEVYARVESFISTARKHGVNVYN